MAVHVRGIHRPALKRVHGGGPGTVDMAKLRIAGREIQHAPILETEGDAAVTYRRDVGGLAVDVAEGRLVLWDVFSNLR